MRTHLSVTTAIMLTAALSLGCGKDDDAGPMAPTPNPSPNPGTGGGAVAATITITSTGASPSSVTIPVGSRVTFVNNDTTSHQMSSDPHPLHTNCPAINQPNLAPGVSGQTGVFSTAGTCGYHDHNQPDNASLQGTIQAQ
jgi:plastocyanin